MFLCSRGSRSSCWPRKERVKTAVVLFSSFSDVWEHKHPPFFICERFRSLTYSHLVILPSLPPVSALHLSLTAEPNAPLPPHGLQSPSKQIEWAAVCACSGLCGFGGDQATDGMKGNETWLFVRWAARGQLSNVSGFGLETWETEIGKEPPPFIQEAWGPGWVWVRELFTHKALSESSSTHRLLCHLPLSYSSRPSVCLHLWLSFFKPSFFLLMTF